MPLASTRRLRLAPFLARSVGFFPPEGCLGHAPVHAQPGPVDALQFVVGHQAGLPQVQEDAGLYPLLEAVVGGGAGAEAGGVQSLPLAAGTQDEEDSLQAEAVRGPGSAAAEAVGVLMFGEEESDGLPQLLGEAPVVGDSRCVHEVT